MRRAHRIGLTVLPIIGTVGGMGGYAYYQFNKKENKTQQKNTSQMTSPDTMIGTDGKNSDNDLTLLSRFKIFPKINSQDFYKYIKLKNGKPFIDDIFIAKVINYILKNIQISDGRIEWGYDLNIAKDDLKVTFNWISDGQGKVFTKTYRLNISKSV